VHQARPEIFQWLTYYNSAGVTVPSIISVRTPCTSGFTRHLILHPREDHKLLQCQARRAGNRLWKERYAKRAGVEGTIFQPSAQPGSAPAASEAMPRQSWPACSEPSRSTSTASTPTLTSVTQGRPQTTVCVRPA
jgi:hypothetical protein